MLIAESMATPFATIVQPEPASDQADDGFQDVGLSSPPEPRPEDASTAGGGTPAEVAAPPAAASEAHVAEPDELDAALLEADEALDLGAPPGDAAPPVPTAGAPEVSADDQFDELMKAEK